MNKNGSIKARNLILIVVFAFLALNIIALPNKINLSYYNCSFLQNAEKQETQNINLKIFNFLSARSTKPVMTPEVKVIPGGQPIGVKIYTKGILVVGFSDIETPSGKKQSPSVIGGIEIGDRIEELNGNKVNTCRELIDFVNKNKGNPINIKVNKNDREKIIKVKPIETVKNDEYKIGLWVRDTTSGVGTMTFYDPESGTFGALGHPINDVDTGLMLTIRDGKIYTAKIMSVEQGTRGNPGELRGMFDEQDVVGNLQKNTSSGIFGKMTKKMESKIYDRPIIVASQNDVKEGPAKVLTSIEGSEVKEYDIYIEKLTEQSKPNSKSMIIRVTDKELISKTGGIVQGMSGSPIIQNGKLVGAVTHVFVNRPDMGYGIYAKWMLRESGINL